MSWAKESEPTIGERQRVTRAKHPLLGDGRAVYQNGPAFFLADAGPVVQFESLDIGGASQTRSWLVGRLAGGERVELDKIGSDHGKTHERIVTEDGRPGWLVWWFDEFGTWCNVFEGDDGSLVKFAATYAHVGHPKDRRKNELPAARAHLMTIGRGKDFTFVYSKEGVTPAAAHAKHLKQLDLLRDIAKREGAST